MDKKPGDRTQPLSQSQVVGVSPNDQSVAWKGNVVGPDEFAPQPPRKSRGRWLVIAGVAAVGVGGGMYAMWPSSSEKDAPAVMGSGSGSGSATPAAVPPPVADAPAPADAPPPVDAAAPADARVDAGSAAPTKKPPPTKKKTPPKKKTH